ncbi:MAG: hypothetical protein U0T81_03540 [Saprospiraceae bacterium]
MNTRILILGSNGQIGTVLAESLRTKYGRDQVICSDVREPKLKTDGPSGSLMSLIPRPLNKSFRKKISTRSIIWRHC